MDGNFTLGAGTRKNRTQHRWGRSSPRQFMAWSHELLGSIDIGVENFNLSPNTAQEGPYNWIGISPRSRYLKEVQVRFTGQLKDGVELLYAQGDRITNMMKQTKFPDLNVPVTWKNREHGDDAPHTRMKDVDNIDLIFILGDKAFQLQVSVITRDNKFWLCAQETHGAQAIKTTAEEANALGLTTHVVNGDHHVMMPLFVENTYPGADYLKNFKDVGPAIIEHSIKAGAVVETDYLPEQWVHTALEAVLPDNARADKGWMKATVCWFNVVIGWGFALDENGKPVHLHFSNILGDDSRPLIKSNHPGILQPMSAIAFKEKIDGNKRSASAIRLIEAA